MKKITLLLLLLLIPTQAFATLALDGHNFTASSCAASPCALTLTTTSTNDVVVVWVKNAAIVGSGATASSISDTAGLTWSKRKAVATSSVFAVDLEEWWAISPGVLTGDTISVSLTGATVFARIDAFGISGANTATPFDVNVSLPASNTNTVPGASSTSTTNSTTNANTMLIAGFACGTGNCNPITVPSGFTQIDGYTSADFSYKIVSATQSSLTETYSWTAVGNARVMISDAVQQAGGGAPASNMLLDSAF